MRVRESKDAPIAPSSNTTAPGPSGDDDHDRSLIVERLAWTPEQRLEANEAFLRFYLAIRPGGPLVGRE